MYEFIRTETGWLLCWGPAPPAARSTPTRVKTPSQPAEDRTETPESTTQPPGTAPTTQAASA